MSSDLDLCHTCEMPMRIDEHGIANHLDVIGAVNHDQDADHVAVSSKEMVNVDSNLKSEKRRVSYEKVDNLETVVTFPKIVGSLGGATMVRASPRRTLIFLAGEKDPVRVTTKQVEEFKKQKGKIAEGLSSFDYAELANKYKKKP